MASTNSVISAMVKKFLTSVLTKKTHVAEMTEQSV